MNAKFSARKLCRQPAPVPQNFDPSISKNRLSFILATNKKWVNGTEIKYLFIEGPKEQQDVVKEAFQQWEDLGIGISFKEVDNVQDSLVRIGFDYSDGSWSYIGRDVLTIPKSERTMNFGWDLTADAYGMTTALHEIGHTIGFNHEHQNSLAGIVWDVDAVYREFSGPPNNWSRSQIDSNIISKVPASQVRGSNWDPDSVMEYEFGAGLVLEPVQYKNGIFPPGTLSALDISGVKSFYPQINVAEFDQLEPMVSKSIKVKSGGYANFIFTAPVTKKYIFQTFGEMDAVMVISEKGDAQNHYLSGDDDSGFNKNVSIKLPLVQGRSYLVNLRVLFVAEENTGGIVVF